MKPTQPPGAGDLADRLADWRRRHPQDEAAEPHQEDPWGDVRDRSPGRPVDLGDDAAADAEEASSRSTMKIAIYSDLHLEFAAFHPPAALEADVVVLAGDIFSPGSKVPPWARRGSIFGERPIVFVPGNHEFYGRVYERQREEMQEQAERFGIHCLQQGSVVIGGVRFIGTPLWTDFALRIETAEGLVCDVERSLLEARRMTDYRVIRMAEAAEDGQPAHTRLLRPQDTLEMHRRERAWLLAELQRPFNGPTVVVTHQAPHRHSLAHRYARDWVSPSFVSELPPEFFEVPALWVHGHTHTSFDYRVGGCRVISNPRGYPQRMTGAFENKGFDPGLVVQV